MKVVFTCGRMNPPTVGHLRLIRAAREMAEREEGSSVVFTTKTHGGVTNPLGPEEKKTFAERAFGVPVRLTTSPYTALEELVANGAKDITFVVGEDRLAKFAAQMLAYATKIGVDLTIRPISRTADAPSASQARQAALDGDQTAFARLVPSPHEGFEHELFCAVRRGLGVECPLT